jgi:hypothetical protein
MRITQEFIDNLSFKGGWKIETLNKKSFYVLTDANYCQIFWLEYWYSIGINAFRSQDFLTLLSDGDITSKVILDPTTGDLLMGPQSWNLIYYLGTRGNVPEPPIIFYVSPFFVLFIYVIFSLVITILYYVFANERTRPF